jgi:hypothetical protein
VVAVGSSAFNPRTLGVTEPGTLLGVTVDLDHGVVDIDEREPRSSLPFDCASDGLTSPVTAASARRNRDATASS